MTKSNINISIDTLLKKCKKYIDDDNELKIINDAYLYAADFHDGEYRKNGDKVINHLLSVAIILTDISADYETISAALLHEVMNNDEITKEELEKLFGKEIAFLVDGVAKITKLHFSTENEALVEYNKKIIVGMSEDVRVLIIKLADRLDNMRTLWALPRNIQKKKARETIEILTPIAHHLGIHKLKSEMEDLSLRYLKPDIFYDVAEKLNNTKLERDQAVNDMINSVSNLLKENKIKHEIKGRSKSIYSIYKKLEKGRKFSDIYDLLALRVFVNTIQECYTVLGIIHSKFRPIPKRFKDYIAMPKVNGYQSLHTTVFGIDGYLFEIQIRTYEMDEIAENGVASHWAYKEHKNLNESVKTAMETKLDFFKSIIDLNEDPMTSEEFVNSVKNEILNNSIYVFTPKGDVFELPKGSTPIDFAYRIHTRIGETTTGAIVNNNMVPLNYKLKNNDIVKIITNKNSTGPSQEWINIVASTHAKNKIKAFFTKNEKDIYIERGKESLEKEMRKQKLVFSEFLSDENIDKIITELKLKDLEELYLSIGNNKYSANYIISIIIPKDKKKKDETVTKNLSIDNNIIVEGIDKVKVNLANCCNPIPGDEIIGYITKGNGISVHRKSCHNLEYLDDRTVNVSWEDKTNNKFMTLIIIYTKTKKDMMIDIIQKAAALNIRVGSIKNNNKQNTYVYEIELYVSNTEVLNKFINELNKIKDIDNIERLVK